MILNQDFSKDIFCSLAYKDLNSKHSLWEKVKRSFIAMRFIYFTARFQFFDVAAFNLLIISFTYHYFRMDGVGENSQQLL